uniref:Uncharacterized protein n=1 Tax=Poecilia reticulata TaxID=8081 RepID=A0A3P9NZR8_POERE
MVRGSQRETEGTELSVYRKSALSVPKELVFFHPYTNSVIYCMSVEVNYRFLFPFTLAKIHYLKQETRYTHEIHIQVTKALKRFLCMYPQMNESSSYPGRAATPLQLLIHKEIG